MPAGEEESGRKLGDLLTAAVAGMRADGILFSGGLDSLILASILAREGGTVKAVTVTLDGTGEDIGYAEKAAASLGLDHHHLSVTVEEAITAIPEVIQIMESFDPALPNDLVVWFAMKYLKSLGAKNIMTGDGADEVFGGYDFMQDMGLERAAEYIEYIAPRMSFSSNKLARGFGLAVSQPFADRRIVESALSTPIDQRIRSQKGTRFGKWILRKAFEDYLPAGLAWQGKRPLEMGSGMSGLRGKVADLVSDEEYLSHSYPVTLMSKEHYYYYKVFRERVGEVPRPGPGEIPCPACGAGMRAPGFHCRVCGYAAQWRGM